MMNDMTIYAEAPLDYNYCEIDPKDNPLYIQYKLLNAGKLPPSYLAEHERYVEDFNNNKRAKSKPEQRIKNRLLHLV